ncbi:MAG TPA: serine/threonine-protein kinase, partial [Pyrinomonadaceae bacterium]|nr:serine/threonine-protein kinase [Pyrinomonadaceae bacterium]
VAVESLIAAHERPDGFIDSPAYEAVADVIAEKKPALVAGQVVGHYQIIAPLGKGGMGEVYLASDTKLDRKVALKLLPAEFTTDKERLRRFVQEARAASSLNHPNIITIHEIGQAGGAHFIATEFIDGKTLKQRMAHERMKLQDILDVSIQVAGAMHAAHAAGIIHRDIKPDNIMLRPDGYVKVLDFGLAKLTEKTSQSKAADLEIDTMVKAHTRPGAVLGTVNYMSPEQARGQVLDQRTDVFSFGIVLYEMAAGRAPFAAATDVDTLVSILQKDPPALEDYTSEVPAEFERIISKALRKDREERYQTIKDLLIDLKSLKEELSFAQKLERSRPPRSASALSVGHAATDASESPTTIRNSVVASNVEQSAQKSQSPNRRLVALALLAVVCAALAIVGGVLWRRGGRAPATTTSATVAQRTLSYWITVQKYRDGKPYQDPFRLRDDINFEKDYRIRLNITSSQSGRLYLLNEGPAGADQTPTFNVLFPSETANNGSAFLNENQQIQIPQQSWFQFDEQQGTEKIWVVWAAKDVPEMEAVKGFANSKDRGVVSSPGLRTAVNQFLKAHSSSTPGLEWDQDKKEMLASANGELLVHAIKLEHH